MHKFTEKSRPLLNRIRHFLSKQDTPAASSAGHGVSYLRKWLFMSVCIGVVAGFGAYAFIKAINWVTQVALVDVAGYVQPQPYGEGGIAFQLPAHWWLIPIVTTVGGLLSGLIVFKLAPEAEGHGTDAAIEAYHHKGGNIRWRIPYVKLVASAITIGTGGSAGREGPTAQIGAGFGSFLGQILGLSTSDRRIAVATGIGAGIGAIFKAPLGGGILAAEILYLEGFEVEVLVPAFIATMVSYSIYASLTGFTPIFGNSLAAAFNDPVSLIFYALLGVLCGLGGMLYSKTFYGVREVFHILRIPQWTKPAVGGLLTGLIAIPLPQVMGMGYGWAQIAMLPNQVQLGVGIMAVLIFAKILATSFSIGSGGSGGVFAPGIVMGGFIGATIWQLLHGISHMPSTPAPFVVVGMMAFFGAIAHAPLAVMAMVAEMTGSYTLLPPAMLALGIATVVVGRNTIYKSQVPSPSASPAHRHEYSFPLMHSLTVRKAMKVNVIKAKPDMTVEEAADIMRRRQIKGLPVVDEGGKLIGIVTNLDVVRVMRTSWNRTKVKDIMITRLVVAHPEDWLDDALNLMREHHINRLPVVADGQPYDLVGIITTSDIVETYHLAKEHPDT